MVDVVASVGELAEQIGADIAALNAAASIGPASSSSSSSNDEKLDLIISLLDQGQGAATVTAAGVVFSGSVSNSAALLGEPVEGMQAATGRTISGLVHLYQSIRDILITRKGSRVMRADYGSDLMALVDGAVNAAWLAAVVVEVAEALERWESRFSLSAVEVTEGESAGRVNIKLEGAYSL